MEMADKGLNFHEMGLDDRLLKAIFKLGWPSPTLVQEKAIPFALNGKDLLMRARTGSGKTAACLIPIIHQILCIKKESKGDNVRNHFALIVVPSRELSQQVHSVIQQLTSSCSKHVTSVDAASEDDIQSLRPALSMHPDIVVGTPSRLLVHIRAGNLDMSAVLRWLVIDEADLLFTYGYEEETRTLLSRCSSSYQAYIMSATFTEDVETLKKLVLHNPVTLNLTEGENSVNKSLTQYHVMCSSAHDKYFLIYALLKLKLLQGKCLIFVNSITGSYRLKLFLEQFSIRCCLLNSELPTNSRFHTVAQFNQGMYDYVIATDESSIILTTATSDDEEKDDKIAKKKKKRAKNYSTSRGMDFQRLTNVINFDFPLTCKSYIHRVGRTARVEASGTALSFVTSDQIDMLNTVQDALTCDGMESAIKPFHINMADLEGLRYRCEDALDHVTNVAVKKARNRELRSEILRSKQLKDYFDSNPRDRAMLRHDNVLHPSVVQPQLKHVPDYLVPETLKKTMRELTDADEGEPQQKRHKKLASKNVKARRFRRHKGDPLRSFKYHSKRS